MTESPPPSRMLPTWAGMRRGLGRGLAVVGGGAVLSSLLMAYARMQAQQANRKLPDEFVLDLDLERYSLVEALPAGPLAVLQGARANKVELRRVVRALDLAGRDSRVKALVTHVGDRQNLAGMATVQELRAAVSQFRHAAEGRGAATVCHSPAFGEAGGNGTLQYYLASAFKEVYMQPTGLLGLLGLRFQLLFFREALDKIKVRPVFYKRGGYKTAADMFTERDLTPQHKEVLQSISQSMVNQLWSGIATSRGLSSDAVHQAVMAAPLTAQQATQLVEPTTASPQGLLSGTKYKDEVYAALLLSPQAQAKKRAEAESKGAASGAPVDVRLPRVPLTKYLLIKEAAEAASAQSGWSGWLMDSPWAGMLSSSRRDAAQQAGSGGAFGAGEAPGGPGTGHRTAEEAGWVPRFVGRGRPKVAVVHAVGPIVQGPVVGPPGPGGLTPPGQQVIDASKLSAQLQQLAEARDVAAVVLRVTSPGGSALGSDTLHHALCGLRAAGKPLVVSCGDVAASGGMYLAVAGDKIFAQPGTLTGSIGVITGKMVAKELAAELGVSAVAVDQGSPNLALQSAFDVPTPDQEAKVNQLMDTIYDDFLSKVAAGRKMSKEAVRPLAGGRVYTGEQAHKVGLVDELGGLTDAIAAAKKLAQLPEEEDKVVVFDYPPRRVPLLLRLLETMGPPGGIAGTDASMAAAVLGSNEKHDGPRWLHRAVGLLGGKMLQGGAGSSSSDITSAASSPLMAYIISHVPWQQQQGEGVGGHMGQVVQAARTALVTACLLDGQVSCIAPEAQMLSDMMS